MYVRPTDKIAFQNFAISFCVVWYVVVVVCVCVGGGRALDVRFISFVLVFVETEMTN